MKRLGTPVRMPSPWTEWKISEISIWGQTGKWKMENRKWKIRSFG
jgi:hypothetical protein